MTVEREWPELRQALTNLIVDVMLHPDQASDSFAAWCREYRFEIEAIAVDGIHPLTDSALERFLTELR